MAGIERMTITLPAEMAAAVRDAVEDGEYASSNEVEREALRDWKARRALQLQQLAAIKADIDQGLADPAAIEAACEPVRHFPLAVTEREQLAPGLRVTFHHRYAIYDRPMPDAVPIVRVLHGARDVAAIADQGGFAG